MKILVIYDDTVRAHTCITRFTPDYDFDLLHCDFCRSNVSVREYLESKVYDQIVIAGESIDKRDMKNDNFVPYDALKVIKEFDMSLTKISLVSPDQDFLNKGKYLAQGKNLNIEEHLIPEV